MFSIFKKTQSVQWMPLFTPPPSQKGGQYTRRGYKIEAIGDNSTIYDGTLGWAVERTVQWALDDDRSHYPWMYLDQGLVNQFSYL